MEDTLIKALIMAADKNKILSAVCVFLDDALLERASARAHRNHARVGELLLGLADGSNHRLRLQHHACTAAERRIVDSTVIVMRKITRIDAAYFDKSFADSTLHNAMAGSLFNLLRE